jgi:ATP synthase protein I
MSEPRDDERPARPTPVTADLEARIARAQARRPAAVAEAKRRQQGDMSGLSRGFRLASEFVAAIIVGAGLGYFIDMVLPTSPWGMVVFVLLGFAAGVLNMTKAAKHMNEASAAPAESTGGERRDE